MANQAAERFLKNLIAASCRRFKPDVIQVELYRSKLSKWYMSEDQWARAMSRFVAEYTDEGLPALPVVYAHLKAVQTDIDRTPGLTMLSFRMDGLSCVLAEKDHDGKLRPKRIDPANPPPLPHGATNGHVVIPPELKQPDPTEELMEVPF